MLRAGVFTMSMHSKQPDAISYAHATHADMRTCLLTAPLHGTNDN